MSTQTALCCGCGSDEFHRAGSCLRCLRRARLSRANFAGVRESVLKRDGYQCQVCGAFAGVLVHHRRAGSNDPKHLLTLCRACHVRVHHTARPVFGFLTQAFLRRLWREANPRLAEQRVLALLGPSVRRDGAMQQPDLFEGA